MMAPCLPHFGALHDLKRRRPEWHAWLVVLQNIVDEIGTPAWDAAVPADMPARASRAPLLAGATLALPMRSVGRLWHRLVHSASCSGMPKMARMELAPHADGDTSPLFTAAICQDSDRVNEVAARAGVDAEALQALVALWPMPFLHACSRRWASARVTGWVEGYCPVCGAWPSFAEVRGIERSRHYRCGRCSAAWYARALSCPYCGTSAHEDLTTLVPEKSDAKSDANAAIEACKRCHGYIKALTRLTGCPPGTVMLEDLASVDLDVAALDHGYRRPAGAAYALGLSVTDSGAARRLFSWR